MSGLYGCVVRIAPGIRWAAVGGGPYSVLGKIIGNSRDGPPWAAARTEVIDRFLEIRRNGPPGEAAPTGMLCETFRKFDTGAAVDGGPYISPRLSAEK